MKSSFLHDYTMITGLVLRLITGVAKLRVTFWTRSGRNFEGGSL